MNNVLTEIAFVAVAPEIEKIDSILQQDIPKNVRLVCQELKIWLNSQIKKVADNQDLTTLRSNLAAVSLFTELIFKADRDKSSWWAEPLIRECYKTLSIDDGRDILIVHSSDTSIDNFCVYPDILRIIQIISSQNLGFGSSLDVFFIPAEVKFDISLIALIAHEVGHIYWQIYESDLEQIVKQRLYNLPKNELIIIDLIEIVAKAPQVASHVEEYVCDYIGSLLLGPAFDYALLRLLSFLPGNDSSPTHPPQGNRTSLSRQRLENYVMPSHCCYGFLKSMCADIPIIGLLNYKDRYDKVAYELATEIHDSIKLKLEDRFSSDKLENIWQMVRPELDGFRPPFETVGVHKPEPIKPSSAIVATTIYFYGSAYIEKNQFYNHNQQPEQQKKEILRKKLIEHLRYAISLNEFIAEVNSKIVDFNGWKKDETLWSWRDRKDGGEPNPFIVTPTIDCFTQYGQNTVDLRLGSSFLVNVPSRYTHIDPAPGKTPISAYYRKVHIRVGQEFILHPHQFVLASILEYICLPHDYYALVLGRSTWGRLGLNIATATTVQAGYRGCLTLELRNLGESPLPLRVGIRIAQLCLIGVPKESTGKGYFKGKGKYIGPVEVGMPKIHEDPDWELFKPTSIS